MTLTNLKKSMGHFTLDLTLDGTYKEKVLEIKGDIETPFVCDVLKKDDRDSIHEILSGKRSYLSDLIDSYIDAGSLDYLRRDSFYTGLPYGNYDDRIFSSFKIINIDNEERIGFNNSPDTINSILSILNARFTLTKAAYFHHTSLIADGMYITALKYALSDNTINEFDIFISRDLELLLIQIETSFYIPHLVLANRKNTKNVGATHLSKLSIMIAEAFKIILINFSNVPPSNCKNHPQYPQRLAPTSKNSQANGTAHYKHTNTGLSKTFIYIIQITSHSSTSLRQYLSFSLNMQPQYAWRYNPRSRHNWKVPLYPSRKSW